MAFFSGLGFRDYFGEVLSPSPRSSGNNSSLLGQSPESALEHPVREGEIETFANSVDPDSTGVCSHDRDNCLKLFFRDFLWHPRLYVAKDIMATKKDFICRVFPLFVAEATKII